MAHKKNEQQEYVSLPYFGINKLLPFLKPYRLILFSMIFLGLTGGLVDIILPLFQRYALNYFIANETLATLGAFIAAYAGVLLFQVFANTISAYQASQIEMYVGRDMKRASFNHLQTLAFSYYNQNSVGYIHARVMSDTNRIGSLVSWGLMDGIWNLSHHRRSLCYADYQRKAGSLGSGDCTADRAGCRFFPEKAGVLKSPYPGSQLADYRKLQRRYYRSEDDQNFGN